MMMFGYAVPPLETAGAVVLMILYYIYTISSLDATLGWSSSDLSSIGLASIGLASVGFTSIGLSSSVYTCNGRTEMVGRKGIYFVQNHHIGWFVPLQISLIF